MSERESAGASDSVFFYVLFVHPLCAWILAPNRLRKDRATVSAIVLMAIIAFGKMGLDNVAREPNHYQRLGLCRGASAIEIKRAYRSLSRELHPDKNPSLDAAERFSKIADALEILKNSEKRKIYDKLGPEAMASKFPVDKIAMLLEMALGYLSWGVFAYLLTLGKGNHQARGWFFTGQIVMLAAEVAIVMAPGGEGVLPSWLFPGMAEYEVVWILHSLFPAYLNACRSLSSHLYVDEAQKTRDMVLAVAAEHQDVLLALREFLANTKSSIPWHRTRGTQLNSAAGGSAGGSAMPAPAPVVGK